MQWHIGIKFYLLGFTLHDAYKCISNGLGPFHWNALY